MTLKQKQEFWFVVGSQHLYGEETLEQDRKQSEKIVQGLNNQANLPYPLRFKQIVTTAEEIRKVIKEVNYFDHVLGVVTWMHTFSPAKLWIPGKKILQKPLLH